MHNIESGLMALVKIARRKRDLWELLLKNKLVQVLVEIGELMDSNQVEQN